MTYVKLFIGGSLKPIDNQINEWIRNNKVYIKDIKFRDQLLNGKIHQYSALVMYEAVKPVD